MADPLETALDLMRRLPASSIQPNVDKLIQLCPDLAEDLITLIDRPLQILHDDSPNGSNREFLACDYNRDGESWRSPWTSIYKPALEDGTQPSDKVRGLEIRANEAFDTYRQMYFETGLSSTYMWDLDDGISFAGVVLFKKELDPPSSGHWDSVHVFEVNVPAPGAHTAHYKVTSTIMLGMGKGSGLKSTTQTGQKDGEDESLVQGDLSGEGIELVGSLQRQTEDDSPVTDESSHIVNLGKIIENQESSMRHTLQEVYFSKTRDVLSNMRSFDSLEKEKNARALQAELMGLSSKRRGAGEKEEKFS